jgi:hypothetical protein
MLGGRINGEVHMTTPYNDIIILAEDKDKKKKKGGGINAILTLMKEMIDFQEQIQACIEAQDLTENKEKIAKCSTAIESMYMELVELVRPAIRPVTETPSLEAPEQALEEKPEPVRVVQDTSQVKKPIAPSI